MFYEIFVSQDARARCEKNDILDLTRPPIQIKTKNIKQKSSQPIWINTNKDETRSGQIPILFAK